MIYNVLGGAESVNLSFQIDEDVAGKFSIALNLTNDEPNEVIENCMRKYIAAAFSNVASSMAPLAKAVTNDNPYYGKANQRIPKWAQRPNQYKSYDNSVTSTIQVQQMVVRDEQDIRSLAVEIATLTRRQQRGKGMRRDIAWI